LTIRSFVPVIAIGFDDIRSRVEAQSTQATEQSQKLTELKKRLSNLESRHSVSNVARLQRAVATQTQITHRLLKMLQHLHLLIPAVRSSAIRPEEEALRTRLEEIEDELRKGRVKSKVNELWALVGAVSADVERGSRGTGGEWAVVDEEGMAQIVQVRLPSHDSRFELLTRVMLRRS
jgi:nuclear pore complex protein Nup54